MFCQAIQWQKSFVVQLRRIKRRIFFQQSFNNQRTLLCTEAFQGKQLPHSAVKGQSKALHGIPGSNRLTPSVKAEGGLAKSTLSKTVNALFGWLCYAYCRLE